MIAIAADPGLSGAIALVCARRGPLEIASLPTCRNAAKASATITREVDAKALDLLRAQWWATHDLAREDVIGVCERIAAYGGKSGPTTMISLADSAGVVRGVLAPRVRTFLQPLAHQWKRTMGVTKEKDSSMAAAKDMFPFFGGIRSHDRAEALLLAAWGLQQENGPVERPAVPEYDPLTA